MFLTPRLRWDAGASRPAIGTGRELYRAVGGLVALAGISAYDSDYQALAQRYLLHALRMAKASGNRSFGGYVVALLANQAMYRGDLRLVIQYAEAALRGAKGGLSPALVSDLHTLQAKAYARMGDASACHEHMRASAGPRASTRRANRERPATFNPVSWRHSTPTRYGASVI